MLLSSLIFALVSPALAFALPTPEPGYAFDPSTALSARYDDDIARLASAVNDAYCPDTDRTNGAVVARSGPAEGEETDVGWIISHDRSRRTYTLAFTSSSPEDTLELLASGLPGDMTALPSTFFGDAEGEAPIYTPYLPLLPIMDQAVDALRNTMGNDRPTFLTLILQTLLPFLPIHQPEPRVEVVGHGLGSITALFASIRLASEDPSLSIETTLFSLPRIGDRSFADTVDHFLARQRSGALSIRRVSSGRDPIPNLPPPHFGLYHPSSIQHLHFGLEADRLGQGMVDDSLGPYAGVTIGLDC